MQSTDYLFKITAVGISSTGTIVTYNTVFSGTEAIVIAYIVLEATTGNIPPQHVDASARVSVSCPDAAVTIRSRKLAFLRRLQTRLPIR